MEERDWLSPKKIDQPPPQGGFRMLSIDVCVWVGVSCVCDDVCLWVHLTYLFR